MWPTVKFWGIMKKTTTTVRNILALVIFEVIMITATILRIAYAGPPTRAHDSERPTVVPLPTSLPIPPKVTPVMIPTTVVKYADLGAHIQLNGVALTTTATNLKAVVQWQAGSGEWYDVEGWQTTTPTDSIVWWVAPKDFGKGPFRWAVYQNEAGRPTQISKSFWLPTSAGEWVFVTLESA